MKKSKKSARLEELDNPNGELTEIPVEVTVLESKVSDATPKTE